MRVDMGEVHHQASGAPDWRVFIADDTWPEGVAYSYPERQAQIRASEAAMDADPERWRLPGNSKGDPRAAGLCAQTDPDLFYPEDGESGDKAKTLCKSCPEQVDCLDGAIQRGEAWGIWGGLNFSESSRTDKSEVRALKRRYRRAQAVGQTAVPTIVT